MAKDHSGSPKLHQLESKRKRLTWILAVSGLCILFYVLGAWQNARPTPSSQSEVYSRVGCDSGSPNPDIATSRISSSSSSSLSVPLDFESHHQLVVNNSKSSENFPPCDMSYSEYTPCQEPQRGRKFDRNMLKYRERHCPSKEELIRCLIPAPPNYKIPFKWPQSRDYAWFANIPHKELSIEKAVQNWVQVEGDRLRFPGGGTMFPHGADAYIDDISELVPLTSGAIRTAIDTGCGVRLCLFITLRIFLLLYWNQSVFCCLNTLLYTYAVRTKNILNFNVIKGCKLGCLSAEAGYSSHVFCSKRYTRSTGLVCTRKRSSGNDWCYGFSETSISSEGF